VVGYSGTYDVEFVDGSCATVFSPCLGLDGFTFPTAAGAKAASDALHLLFGDHHAYDDQPILTNGCDAENCAVMTANSAINGGNDVRVSVFYNFSFNSDVGDYVAAAEVVAAYDTADEPFSVYARWTQTPTAVDIDVDPWSTNNKVYPNSDYAIAAAVLGSNEFDVMQINPATVKLGFATTYTPNPWFEDVDHDPSSIPDAIFAFHTEETGIFCNATEVILTGDTFGGDKFSGTDTIDATDCTELMCHPL
jgi:hypothetical protein